MWAHSITIHNRKLNRAWRFTQQLILCFCCYVVLLLAQIFSIVLYCCVSSWCRLRANNCSSIPLSVVCQGLEYHTCSTTGTQWKGEDTAGLKHALQATLIDIIYSITGLSCGSIWKRMTISPSKSNSLLRTMGVSSPWLQGGDSLGWFTRCSFIRTVWQRWRNKWQNMFCEQLPVFWTEAWGYYTSLNNSRKCWQYPELFKYLPPRKLLNFIWTKAVLYSKVWPINA